MTATQQRNAAVFDEWVKRYAANPAEFAEILDADGKPFEGYGQRCAVYFDKLAAEMEGAGTLPVAV